MKIAVAAVAILAATPAAAATTCAEYEQLIYAEGVRTLLAIGCVDDAEASSLPKHWNYVLNTPAGACLVSRSITGVPEVLALTVYFKSMNDQKSHQGCPPAVGSTQPAQLP